MSFVWLLLAILGMLPKVRFWWPTIVACVASGVVGLLGLHGMAPLTLMGLTVMLLAYNGIWLLAKRYDEKNRPTT